jgi:hypothetical protein
MKPRLIRAPQSSLAFESNKVLFRKGEGRSAQNPSPGGGMRYDVLVLHFNAEQDVFYFAEGCVLGAHQTVMKETSP